MKLISQRQAVSGDNIAVITLQAQNKEDLFTLYNIINKDDELIFKKKLTLKKDEESKKKIYEVVKIRVRVISSDFEPENEFLKYKGITTEDDIGNANADIRVGKYFSIAMNYKYPFTLVKKDPNEYFKKVLKESYNLNSRSDIAAVVLQEGLSHICLVSTYSTILKHKVEYSLPKKKRNTDIMKYNEKTEKFYKNTYESMLRHFDFDHVKVILLCSPAFYAKKLYEKIIRYAEEDRNSSILDNKSKILVAHCSTGYLQGLSEVLRDPSYESVLMNVGNSRELRILDKFLKHLNEDDNKAWYGEMEVFKAAELGAIDTLLITDTWMRSDDLKRRAKAAKITKDVEKKGGRSVFFSSLHSSGAELDKLTGLACILKYSIPDLDMDLDDGDDSLE